MNRGFYVLKNERTDHTFIDLCAGCGGLSEGLHNAGFVHKLSVENNKNAVQTLRTNQPGWNVLQEDIRLVDLGGAEVDMVACGFPCQSFSYAGQRRGFEDTRGTVFYEFIRLVKDIQPMIALGENVRGLINHDGGKTLATILQSFRDIGYTPHLKLLNALHYDVPQKRERVFIVAVRNDFDITPDFPVANDYTLTMRDALEGCPVSEGAVYPEWKKEVMRLVPPGGCWRDLPPGIQEAYMGKSFHLTGGRTGMARRLAWDEPSLTLLCGPAQKQTERCHPEETRPLTVREYARIQTFPDEWQVCGSLTAKYTQIGNAVPVNQAYHMGRSLIATLERIKDASRVPV